MDKTELTLQEALEQLAANKTAMEQLQAQNQELQTKLDNQTQQLQAAHDQELQALVDAAVADGRIQQAHSDKWTELLHLAESTTRSLLESLAPATSLSAQLKQHADTSRYAGKSWNQLDVAGQLAAYKRDDPEGFRALYKDTFGKDYIG